MSKAVAVLDVMWGGRSLRRSVPHFTINPSNHSGKRLYWLLGHTDLLVTNACPQMVVNAKGRGKPNREWLATNLASLQPFELLLVCGKVAQDTVKLASGKGARILFVPHPAARMWTKQALSFTRDVIQHGITDLELEFIKGRLVASRLIPF